MPFCPQCGSEMTNEARFCRACGTAVGITQQSVPPVLNDQPVATAQQESASSSNLQNSVPPTHAQTKASPLTGLGLVAIVLVSMVGGAYLVGAFSSKDPASNSTLNATNGEDTEGVGEGEEESEGSAESASTDEDLRDSCQSNLKQIALAFKMYLNDFDQRYPVVAVTNNSSDGNGNTTYSPAYGWADALQPYIRNAEVFQCPSDTFEGSNTNTHTGFSDYYYNRNFVRHIQRGDSFLYTGANESMLGSSAQTVLAGDGGSASGLPTGSSRYAICGDSVDSLIANNSNQTNGIPSSGSESACGPTAGSKNTATDVATYPAAQIHMGGSNMAFADGHVKWIQGDGPTSSQQVLSKHLRQDKIGDKLTFSLLNQ